MNMEKIRYMDEQGSFRLENPEQTSGLYFPIANELGLKSAVTPSMTGDAKLDQNHFLLEPASIMDLQNKRTGRNFWCYVKGIGSWSVCGASAEEASKRFTNQQDKSAVEAGFLWHTVYRESVKYQLSAQTRIFAAMDVNAEIITVTVKNTGKQRVTFVPTAAIPIFGRSADNLRDHRHVTSLLHRINVVPEGVEVEPTLSFDERGHKLADTTYFVYGYEEDGVLPESFFPTLEEYIGEGGDFERPCSVIQNLPGVAAETKRAGREAMGAFHFRECTLAPDEEKTYILVFGAVDRGVNPADFAKRYQKLSEVEKAFGESKKYWDSRVNIAVKSGDSNFDRWMKWVSFQPTLRRIFGCSFLPHHDYGKGGRGWRDLWQDCLALLLMDPEPVGELLYQNFGGVRPDGTNATIIGSKPGEFIADRNNITRVWMDHGVWPCITTKLYLDETGDYDLLWKEAPYFLDKQVMRGEATDEDWEAKAEKKHTGTVLEHLLLQNLTAFYDVGEHNIIRLRGADWNDALDMAKEKGESVAFTNAYAQNLEDLAGLLRIAKERGINSIVVAERMIPLFNMGADLYDSVEKKHELLQSFLENCVTETAGETKQAALGIEECIASLQEKADWMRGHIRTQEWVEDGAGHGWFNSYYDNHGNPVEGNHDGDIRMMLTGQVFAIMDKTADENQAKAIADSADAYLYDEQAGGYRLNTNFHEVKTDLGRMFGFAYGEKENGAVFSHMTVMYAYALYSRGLVKEGYKALHTLYEQASDEKRGKMYPGIPEYFEQGGKGVYQYLTGAASWYLYTVLSQMYGIVGCQGDLVLEPKLLADQFNEDGDATATFTFAGKKLQVTYHNAVKAEYGSYRIGSVYRKGQHTGTIEENGKNCRIDREEILSWGQDEQQLIVELVPCE